MKTVFALFARDVRRLARNPVALVILVGALVLPSLYAWYCIAANWDPYQNTAGIRVAVANEDQGAQSGVAGHLDVGAQVVDELKDNHQLGWEFVPESEALRGVESGDYYAAIVIPADFSASFASLLTEHHERPRIDYYVNEEMNAVAVKVTDTGANTVDDQINDTFAATVAKAATDALKGFAGQVKAGADEAGGSVAREVAQAAQAIEGVRRSLDGVGAQVDSSLAAADAAQQTLDEIEAQLPSVRQALDEASSALQDARREATGLSSGLSQAVGQATSSLGRAAARAHAAIGTVAGDILQVQGQVDGMLSDAEVLEAQNEALVEDLKGLEDQYPQIADAVALLETQNAQHRQTIADLRRTSEGVKDAADKAISASDSVNAATQDALAAIDQAQRDIAAGALPDLSSGLDAFSSAAAQMAGAVAGLEPALEQAQGLLDALRGTLCEAKGTAASASSALESTQDGLTTTVTDLEALNDSATIEKLSTLWGIEPANVADFMASPVKIDTRTVYAVDNYGSGVAPFYTNLALWVGGFVLIAIIKLEVDPRGMRPFGPTQGYLGRWLLFVVLGAVQALVVCAGDLVMGMQCVSPVAFVAAGAFTSFVYVSLIYALAATFKHIGKALAVVLLIMQIPGSAGMYPIEMMPPAFQMVHPFLPFTYGIEAMRETIAGMYDAHYFIDLGRLALFLPFAFLVGLVARPYLLNFNLLFDRKLAKTDVMVSEEGEAPRVRYRLRTVIQALLDTEAYRAKLVGRFERFERRYPALRRLAIALLAALPVLLLAVMSVLPVDVNGKIVALCVFVLVLVAVCFYLIVIEYAHDNLAHQMQLAALDASELEDRMRQHVPRCLPHERGRRDRREGKDAPRERGSGESGGAAHANEDGATVCDDGHASGDAPREGGEGRPS